MKTQFARIPAAALGAACLAGPALSAERTVETGDFSAVDAANGVNVEIVVGGPAGVVIDGRESQLGNVDIEVNGDTLRIRPERRPLFFGHTNVSDVTVRVSLERLDAVEAANGAAVRIADVPADSEIALAAVNGAMLEAAGLCGAVSAQAARGGMLDASALDCRAATAEASMGGMAAVRASERVVASASMGGLVDVHGDAEDADFSSSMGGQISRSGG
ncbi:MAG: DUF2807 domain-containing protein [Maricaulaceae bacterium]|jgi:hypothetical protein